MDSVELYGRFEAALEGPQDGNPFLDVDLAATFTLGHRSLKVRGFYDGDGVYRVRFMPDAEGEWTWVTASSVGALDGVSGSFTCSPAAGSHGPVRAVKTHFAYDDGTPYVPVGTTAYAWIHQPQELRDATVKTLSQSPFTKIRMCVFPKDYRYNRNEPDSFAFPGTLSDGFDLTRFDVSFFGKLDAELQRLADLGIEADLILFHPYDRWGFEKLDPDVEERYLTYLIARVSAFPNVWWSMANEWDFMQHKDESDFHRYFRIVQREDPYGHLRGVHNGTRFYDHGRAWVTHVSVQHGQTERCSEWVASYGKPVVVDECVYEGDIPEGWGCLTAAELVRREWTAFVHGGWPAAHGETYYNDEEVLWWSKGGSLTGESPQRLGFLRRVIEEAPVADLMHYVKRWDQPQIEAGEDYFLFYLGFQRSRWKEWDLPEDRRYTVDVIDTWNMTIERLAGVYSGATRIPLPGREYMAIRVMAAET